MAPEIIQPKESMLATPQHIINYVGGKYYLFFKDCVGTIDGTHIHTLPPQEQHLAFKSGRNPKHCTQNVLGVWDFSMIFTFVPASWEGTAHHYKVLNHVIYDLNNNFPFPPKDTQMLYFDFYFYTSVCLFNFSITHI